MKKLLIQITVGSLLTIAIGAILIYIGYIKNNYICISVGVPLVLVPLLRLPPIIFENISWMKEKEHLNKKIKGE